MLTRRKLWGALIGALVMASMMVAAQAAPERSGGREAGFSYAGKYSEEVKYLLSQDQCPAWSTGANDDGTPLSPPKFDLTDDNIMRDKYIAAATTKAWAAEAYARIGKSDQAEPIAKSMMVDLKSAADLCGHQPTVDNPDKSVTAYITCEWLKARNYDGVDG